MSVKTIPEGFHTVTPYLAIKGAAQAIEFYKQAFGATERFRLSMPDGGVGHAEICIGDSNIMLSDECGESQFHSPATLGGPPLASTCMWRMWMPVLPRRWRPVPPC
ncbi:hypothetical protein [Marinobacterium rhizophilum]|uniref:hypothetical protein n=1 Tax=Marinobacterium rhizophilum TaxID=420402 RepID=UPI001F0A3DB3|nr:hypothetical protein [Marinobacterium rhizophilum]